MANRNFSSFVFTVIDLAGINDDIKRKRIESQKKAECCVSECFRHKDHSLSCIYTGSTSEGTIPYALSDNDIMIVLNDTLCVDKAKFDVDINSAFNVITAEYENMPPGYVKIAAAHINNDKGFTRAAMFKQRSYWYRSSTDCAPYISHKFLKQFKGSRTTPSSSVEGEVYNFGVQELNINGPALTHKAQFRVYDDLTSTELFSFEYDNVYAIPFYNASILTEWSSRTRRYDWPSEELIQEVSTMEGFILPVGEKKSETEHIEWRISHVTSEKILIKSLNNTQYKLYVVLKLFSKQVFAPISKSVSSYIVKNIVLWMAECNPIHQFTPDNFIDCILQSFNFIKNCLICNHLPSYIMPKKNLIAGRIIGDEKRDLIFLLLCLLDEGAYLINRIPKLASCLNYVSIHPDVFSKFCIWRHCVERQMLLLRDTCFTCLDTKFLTENLFNKPPFHLERLIACKDKRLLFGQFILLKLLIPDYLDRVPNVNFGEMIRTLYKRIECVHKCCFL